jgi:hypothetical protein
MSDKYTIPPLTMTEMMRQVLGPDGNRPWIEMRAFVDAVSYMPYCADMTRAEVVAEAAELLKLSGEHV